MGLPMNGELFVRWGATRTHRSRDGRNEAPAQTARLPWRLELHPATPNYTRV